MNVIIEIFYFEGCPNYEPARELVERVGRELGVDLDFPRYLKSLQMRAFFMRVNSGVAGPTGSSSDFAHHEIQIGSHGSG